MIVIVKISLNLIERVIRNYPPRVPCQPGCCHHSGARGRSPGGVQGQSPGPGRSPEERAKRCSFAKGGMGGNPVDCPLPSTADAVGAIIPDPVGTSNSDVVGAIKSTLNQQPNIHLTLNIHTEGARKRGGRVNPLWVDAPPMRARLSQYGQPAAINAINNRP